VGRHPNTDEWQYYIDGQGRMGVLGASGQARTFDFRAGDVGFVPFAMGHYVEKPAPRRCAFSKSSKATTSPISLDQWMALMPPELVEAHLKLDRQVMDALRKTKAPVVPA
jgi:oxalate decarboxylase